MCNLNMITEIYLARDHEDSTQIDAAWLVILFLGT